MEDAQGVLLMLLEHDSMAVRLSAIHTMSIFARSQGKQVRMTTMRFLIDMLNDEIDEVRIGALHGIARFNDVLKLNDSEVETVLFNLNEDNFKLRSEIYKFFAMISIDKDLLLRLIENWF